MLPSMLDTSNLWLVSILNVTKITEELNFKLYLIVINLYFHSCILDHRIGQHSSV